MLNPLPVYGESAATTVTLAGPLRSLPPACYAARRLAGPMACDTTNFTGFPVDNPLTEFPLPQRFPGRFPQHRIAADHLDPFNRTFLQNEGLHVASPAVSAVWPVPGMQAAA